jgi:apolipoprotein N-acyltransferase
MDPWDKWSLSPEGQVLKHIDIQDSLAKVSGKSDLALWSETAIPYLSMSFNCYNNFSFLQRWIDTSGTYLITGMARYELFDKETAPALSKKAAWDSTVYFQAYNSSVLISPNMSNPPQIYRKSKLTPFAERIPYAEYIPFATDFLNWGVGISAWGKGDSISTLNFKKDNFQYKIGNIICIESIYPEFCTQFVNEGANILVIITNDAWYNHTPGPYQHYMIARARAIENRRFIARCANSGISGLISLTGESVSELPQYEQAGIKVEVPAITEISIYSKYGDFIGKISFVFVLISIIYAKYSKINITQNKD